MSEAEYLEQFSVGLAMWADENLWSHDTSDEDYEEDVRRFCDELHERAFSTLMERPVR